MIEEEGGRGSAGYEDGEIVEALPGQFHPGHQPRSQSQSFTAPRFAALAQQQQQQQIQQQQDSEVLGPSGRPQLAPTFVFGARRRGSVGPSPSMGHSISEEESNFQFPHQQQQDSYQQVQQSEHGRTASTGGEITGIMAEQVCIRHESFLVNTTDVMLLDCSSKSDRGSAAAATGVVPTTARFEPNFRPSVPEQVQFSSSCAKYCPSRHAWICQHGYGPVWCTTPWS